MYIFVGTEQRMNYRIMRTFLLVPIQCIPYQGTGRLTRKANFVYNHYRLKFQEIGTPPVEETTVGNPFKRKNGRSSRSADIS
jgi:hypothetical protein